MERARHPAIGRHQNARCWRAGSRHRVRAKSQTAAPRARVSASQHDGADAASVGNVGDGRACRCHGIMKRAKNRGPTVSWSFPDMDVRDGVYWEDALRMLARSLRQEALSASPAKAAEK